MPSQFKSAKQIYVNPMHFEIQLLLKNDLVSHTLTIITKIDEIRKITWNPFIG